MLALILILCCVIGIVITIRDTIKTLIMGSRFDKSIKYNVRKLGERRWIDKN